MIKEFDKKLRECKLTFDKLLNLSEELSKEEWFKEELKKSEELSEEVADDSNGDSEPRITTSFKQVVKSDGVMEYNVESKRVKIKDEFKDFEEAKEAFYSGKVKKDSHLIPFFKMPISSMIRDLGCEGCEMYLDKVYEKIVDVHKKLYVESAIKWLDFLNNGAILELSYDIVNGEVVSFNCEVYPVEDSYNNFEEDEYGFGL